VAISRFFVFFRQRGLIIPIKRFLAEEPGKYRATGVVNLSVSHCGK
jgi:hypothetical protein